MDERFIKITNAVYSLLDFFPDGEPLKNRAKDKALAIMENSALVFGTEGWASLQKEKASVEILGDIEILLDYLKLGRSRGWISSVNFLVISKEYEKLRDEIKPLSGLMQNVIKLQMPEQKPKIAPITVEDIPPRQKKILEILKEKGRAQVLDFNSVLSDVTKRTIRRDLDELMRVGKIARFGEFNQVFYRIAENEEIHENHEFHENR